MLQDTVVIEGEVSLENQIDGDAELESLVDGDAGVQLIATDILPATRSTLGGIIVGEDLDITQEGVLSIIKANRAEQDNTHPITAAAVYTEIGNIDALLQTL